MDYSAFLPETRVPRGRIIFWGVVVLVTVVGALGVGGRVFEKHALLSVCRDAVIPAHARVVSHDTATHTITLAWNEQTEITLTIPCDPEHIFEGCSPSAKQVLAWAYRELSGEAVDEVALPRRLRKPDLSTTTAETCASSKKTTGGITIPLEGKRQEGKCVAVNGNERIIFENTTRFPTTIWIMSREPFPEFPRVLHIAPYATGGAPFMAKEYLSVGVHQLEGDPSVVPEIVLLPFVQ